MAAPTSPEEKTLRPAVRELGPGQAAKWLLRIDTGGAKSAAVALTSCFTALLGDVPQFSPPLAAQTVGPNDAAQP